MLGEPVILLRASVTGQDSYGNDVTTLTPENRSAAWVPGSEAEITTGTEAVTADAECYLLPPGTAPGPLDQLTRVATGETFQVVGESSSWTSPFTGVASPVLVRLRRITGATVTGGG